MSTKIEWTDVTDNIIVVKSGGWWCRKISPACKPCYAERLNNNSWFGGNKRPYSGKPPELKLKRDVLQSWARQRKAKKHFVASMTDVFGEWVKPEWQFEFLDSMLAAPLQTFQLLTKRADVMALHVSAWLQTRGLTKMPANIWLGFTGENQEWFDQRWEHMRSLLRFEPIVFVSVEGSLGPVTLPADFLALGKRAQVITGGESGDKDSHPMLPAWPRWLRDQCTAAGVRFFFKQWGDWLPLNKIPMDVLCGEKKCAKIGEQTFAKVGKKMSGRLLDGRTWNEFPLLN